MRVFRCRSGSGARRLREYEHGRDVDEHRSVARKPAEISRIYFENLAALESESWDEAAYRWFYRDDNGPLWDRLRPELNWKPYWGESAQAKIIHFHGPKPFQRDHIESHWPELKSLTGGAYHAVVEQWSELLREAR